MDRNLPALNWDDDEVTTPDSPGGIEKSSVKQAAVRALIVTKHCCTHCGDHPPKDALSKGWSLVANRDGRTGSWHCPGCYR